MFHIRAPFAQLAALLLPSPAGQRRDDRCGDPEDLRYDLLDDLVEALCVLETARIGEALYGLHLAELAAAPAGGDWPHSHCPGCGFAGVYDGTGCILCGHLAPDLSPEAAEEAWRAAVAFEEAQIARFVARGTPAPPLHVAGSLRGARRLRHAPRRPGRLLVAPPRAGRPRDHRGR